MKAMDAKTLLELRDLLNTADLSDVDMCNLPTFGGETPKSTDGVWSWDEEHVLVGDAAPFTIERRDPEAWYAQ